MSCKIRVGGVYVVATGNHTGERYRVTSVERPHMNTFFAGILGTKESIHWAIDTCEEVDTEVLRMRDIISLCQA